MIAHWKQAVPGWQYPVWNVKGNQENMFLSTRHTQKKENFVIGQPWFQNLQETIL